MADLEPVRGFSSFLKKKFSIFLRVDTPLQVFPVHTPVRRGQSGTLSQGIMVSGQLRRALALSIPLRRARSTFDQPLCFSFIGTCVWVRVWVWVRVRVWVWVCGSGASAGVLKPRRSGTVWQVQIGPGAFLVWLHTHTEPTNIKATGWGYDCSRKTTGPAPGTATGTATPP